MLFTKDKANIIVRDNIIDTIDITMKLCALWEYYLHVRKEVKDTQRVRMEEWNICGDVLLELWTS